MNESQINTRLSLDEKIKEFVRNNENCFFVDIMGNTNMRREDIFVEDGVHLNNEGYKYFGEMFKEVLKDELERF